MAFQKPQPRVGKTIGEVRLHLVDGVTDKGVPFQRGVYEIELLDESGELIEFKFSSGDAEPHLPNIHKLAIKDMLDYVRAKAIADLLPK